VVREGESPTALLLGLVPLYGGLADRLPRRRLLSAVTGFFVLCLIGSYLLAQAGVAVGIPFFLWVGIVNLMIVAQFWSFADELYTRDQGERLFPIVAFGATRRACPRGSPPRRSRRPPASTWWRA
jgi:AAA family ATP:ADP antiporter